MKNRTISWFSCGAASAVATKLSNPDVIAYCDTGSEDHDNARFMEDCKNWFSQDITVLKNQKYKDTWDVWEKENYISGVAGAPCTRLLKVKPRLQFQQEGDIHIFGYTADSQDMKRAEALRENWPELNIHTPLIEAGINKEACLAIVKSAGIRTPRVYDMGFPHANCVPCPKAESPAYWAIIREEFPLEFERMVKLSRKLNVRLSRIEGQRIYIDEIPIGQAKKKPVMPACDFLCQIALQEM